MQEDRWEKLEGIVKKVVEEALDARGLKAKQKLGFANGKWTGLTTEQLEAWKAAYGSCDVETELKKMAAWIVSNPHLAPKSQLGRFINTWLSRQQNVLSIRSIPTRNDAGPFKNGVCAYCQKPSTGKVNGNEHCNEHGHNAMDNERPAKRA